jgi:hypothetical protein
MRDMIGDLRLVQEGLLRKLIAAGDAGLLRSQLLHQGTRPTAVRDKRYRSLRRLELAGKVRSERTTGWRRSERWFALVDDPTLERGLDAYGEPYEGGHAV